MSIRQRFDNELSFCTKMISLYTNYDLHRLTYGLTIAPAPRGQFSLTQWSFLVRYAFHNAPFSDVYYEEGLENGVLTTTHCPPPYSHIVHG